MAWLRDLFETNQIIVLSIYGQVFFLMGLAIALQSRKRSELSLRGLAFAPLLQFGAELLLTTRTATRPAPVPPERDRRHQAQPRDPEQARSCSGRGSSPGALRGMARVCPLPCRSWHHAANHDDSDRREPRRAIGSDPNGSGTDACREITRRLPGTPVVMLTSYADADALFAAIAAGASGYVLKRIGSEELVDVVRAVAAGESMLDSAVTGTVLQRLRETASDEEPGAFTELTDQERRVLAEVASGASNREIGARLDLAEKTVRNYVSSVLAKLELMSRAEVAGYAIRHRLRDLGAEGERHAR